MKALLGRIDRLRLIALLLWMVPVLALVPLGLLWLWQAGATWLWLLALSAFSAAGYGLQFWLRQRQRALLAGSQTQPDPGWPPVAEGAWALVEELADQTRPEDWPIGEGGRLVLLGQRTLEGVARHFHPRVDRPLLEITLPHTLLIIERAARDLRGSVTTQIPLSHRLTLGSLVRAYRWRPVAEGLLGLYRAGHWVLNPAQAVLTEVWTHLRGRAFGLAQEELVGWILREYVRKVGAYAIELYSGRLPLSDIPADARPTAASGRDLRQTRSQEEAAPEPLRILVLGRSNAGKSSLINALFDKPRVATDLLPGTTQHLTPHRLEREGLDLALVYDSPGSDTLGLDDLWRATADADMILWVSAAHRPDRASERMTLDHLRARIAKRLHRRAPPLLVVLTQIDRLRPVREWTPPYDLTQPLGPKAESIRGAVTEAAQALAVPADHVIPVCLAAGRAYNVNDLLWSAILERLDVAQRARLLRCQEALKDEETWRLLRRQLAGAGRFLLALPDRLNRGVARRSAQRRGEGDAGRRGRCDDGPPPP